jgi:hypothetical protein
MFHLTFLLKILKNGSRAAAESKTPRAYARGINLFQNFILLCGDLIENAKLKRRFYFVRILFCLYFKIRFKIAAISIRESSIQPIIGASGTKSIGLTVYSAAKNKRIHANLIFFFFEPTISGSMASSLSL